MKKNDSWTAVFVLSLLTTLIVVVSGCAGPDRVQAQSSVINSMIFGYSSVGPNTNGGPTTAFLETRIGDPVNTDFSSVPMPSHATLGHLHFVTNVNTLNSAAGVVSVYVNGVPSAVTCNVNPSVMTCSDTTHTVMVNEGDLVTIGVTIPAGSGGTGFLGPFRASSGITFE